MLMAGAMNEMANHAIIYSPLAFDIHTWPHKLGLDMQWAET